MNYFILTQDERIPNVVEPVGIASVIKKERLAMEHLEELEALDRQFPVLEKAENDYIDYLEKPIPLLSNPLKRLIKKYAPKMPMKSVVLVNQKEKSQVLYWLMIPPTIACLSPQTEFHPDGTVKRLVIEEELAASSSIFKIEGIKEEHIVVNVALAESLLRRDFRGIRLRKIETVGRWQEIQESRA